MDVKFDFTFRSDGLNAFKTVLHVGAAYLKSGNCSFEQAEVGIAGINPPDTVELMHISSWSF